MKVSLRTEQAWVARTLGGFMVLWMADGYLTAKEWETYECAKAYCDGLNGNFYTPVICNGEAA